MDRQRIERIFSEVLRFASVSILFLATTARADFEIYHKKGFAKAVEILEKKTNDDGTLRVKAKKANGEIVEIDQVQKITEVEKKTGMKDSGIVPPTPTPIILPGQGYSHRPVGSVQGSAPPPPPHAAPPGQIDIDGVVENYRPDVTSVMENFKWVAVAIAGVATLVVLFFIISKLNQ